MKYLLGFLLGMLLGTLTAGTLIYFNPLTTGNSSASLAGEMRLSFSVSERRSPLFTHSGALKLPQYPADVPQLWESGMRGTLLAAMVLNDESSNTAALATRISVPSMATNPVRYGALTDDYWLVTMPGRGSIWLHTVSNQWPLLKDSLIRIDGLKRSWGAATSYFPTIGPTSGGAGRAVGLSGEFAGGRGSVRERIDVGHYGVRGFENLAGELGLSLERE
jgi:hypothetical protein